MTESQRITAAGSVKHFLSNRACGRTREEYIQALVTTCGHDWFRDRIEKSDFRMATWNQVNGVSRDVQIVSHGMHHASQNSMLEASDFETEYVGSRAEIRQHTGTAPQGFSLPNGIHSDQSMKWLREAGYSFCLTSTAGRISTSSDRMSLPRFRAEVPLSVLRNLMAN